MTENILKEEERVAFTLRSLYKKYGYLPYKMSKFEEYDLYVTNKEFLLGDGVITFNDTDGKLLALKPDVTLSIIKNSADDKTKRKVYYNENVYRISGGTKQFKEIPQAGLECIGDIDGYDVFETICLAAESLSVISKNFVLDISHLGVLFAIIQDVGATDEVMQGILRCLAEKNAHALAQLCEKNTISNQAQEKLQTLLSAYGNPACVLQKIQPLCQSKAAKAAFDSLQSLCALLQKTKYADAIRLDFSVVNDRNYYDDIVFKGFVDGIAEGVLSGGRYDKLMTRMGKSFGAIGFAVNLDLLEGFNLVNAQKDVDVLVVYNEDTPVEKIDAIVQKEIAKGNTVRAQKQRDGVRYQTLVDITGGGV